MKKVILCILTLMVCTGCSELLLLSSMGGAVVSQSPAVKAYNGIDMLTIIKTEKDIKQHAYDKLKGNKK
jgi:uncharacterized protein YcfL